MNQSNANKCRKRKKGIIESASEPKSIGSHIDVGLKSDKYEKSPDKEKKDNEFRLPNINQKYDPELDEEYKGKLDSHLFFWLNWDP